jgi:hypothetical protein
MSDVIPVGREGVARHRWTTGSQWPAANSLYVGEIAVGLADPMMLWVGVPTALDPSGIKLLYDAQSATEAPADGQVYGRRGSTVSWQAVLPLTGGTLTGPLVVPNGTAAAPGVQFGAADGTGISRASNALVFSVQGSTILGTFAGSAQFYGQLSMLNNKITQLADPTTGTDALNLRYADGRYATPLNIPLASTQPPLMDGTASPGSSGYWSAGDHVHPSDTAKLSLTGGRMSGGIAFGDTMATGPADLSKHLMLWDSPPYGFSVTGGRLNIVTGQVIGLCLGNNDIAVVQTGGMFMAGTNTVTLGADPTTAMQAATRQYVDAKAGNYLPLAGGTLTGGLSFGSATAASTRDLSRHIALFGTIYGINVTASRLNFVTDGTGALYYVNNGNDVFRVNNTGTVTFGYVGNTLTLTPNDGAKSGNISFVGAASNSIFEFDNPIFLPGIATGVSIGPAIWLGNSSHQIRGNAGQDGASMAVANYSLNSWNGIGFGPNISGMPIPQWMYGLVIDTRAGSVINYGNFYAYNALPNAWSTIQHISFIKSGFDQVLQLDGNSIVATLPSATPVAGGSGCNVNDRFYDAFNNTYTATAVTAGAVTTIALNAATARFGAVPANPVALTAAPGFSGTGVTVNLTWVAPTRFVLRATGAGQSMLLSAPGGITAGNPITLPSDPTTALQASTKQYVDAQVATAGNGRFLPLAGGTMSGPLEIDNPGSFTLYGPALFQYNSQTIPAEAGGLAIQWNLTNGGGEIVFFNTGVGGNPGFDFRRITGASASVRLAYLDPNGTLTLAGPVVLPADPTTAMQAVTKQYVDQHAAGLTDAPNDGFAYGRESLAWQRVVPLAGGMMTGNLAFGVTPPADMTGANAGIVANSQVISGVFAIGAYIGTNSWTYLRSFSAAWFGQGTNGAQIFGAPTGTAGNPVTWGPALRYTYKGNLGLAVEPPINQSVANALGGWMFGWGITVGNWTNNLYFDGTNWRYLAAGTGLEVSAGPSGSGWAWLAAPSGAADAVATLAAKMSLDLSGNLTVNGNLNTNSITGTVIHSSGAITAGGNVNAVTYFASGAIYASYPTAQTFYLNGDGTNNVISFQSGYYFAWSTSNGLLQYVANSATAMSIDYSGNATFAGLVRASGGGVYIGNGGNGVVLNFAANWYLDWNATNGTLTYIGGGAKFWCDQGGNFTAAGNLHCAAVGVVYDNLQSNGFNFRWDGSTTFIRVDNAAEWALQGTSDERLKFDIEPATFDCLAAIRAMPLHQFRWRDYSDLSAAPVANANAPVVPIGLVAQRVHKVLPEAAVVGSEEGANKGATTMWAINANTMIAALCGAVQQLAERVELLEAA